VAMERARRQLLTARQRLAAMWGSSRPTFDSVRGDIDALTPIPTMENLLSRLSQNPELARWATEVALRNAQLDVAKSKGIPDLTVSAGMRHFAETTDLAGVAGVSVAIPIFDRNQGEIRKSRFEVLKALNDRHAAEVRVRTALEEAYQSLSTAYETAVTLKAEVLPGAEEAFAVANKSYTEGKLPYIDVLDAQRTLFEARGQYTDALTEYHKAVAEVERLIGDRLGGDTASGPATQPATQKGTNP
jgi:outer membrane protein, heavy metal efflux system